MFRAEMVEEILNMGNLPRIKCGRNTEHPNDPAFETGPLQFFEVGQMRRICLEEGGGDN
jgi:hypothetical protein